MTIYADLPAVETPPPAPTRWNRRRIIAVAAVTLVLLGIVGTAIGWAVYANTYQPLTVGNFGGGADPNLKIVTDGVTDTRRVLFGNVGTRGRFATTIANWGDHDVQILGLGDTSGRFTATWGPDHPVPPTGYVGGTPAQSHRFPALLRPGHQLVLFVVVTKPHCPPGGYEEWRQLPIRWSALGVHHQWQLPLNDEAINLPVDVCAPRSAARYLDKRFS